MCEIYGSNDPITKLNVPMTPKPIHHNKQVSKDPVQYTISLL